MASFEIISDITEIEVIAIGSRGIHKAELHWYEAHGIGRKEYKRKRYLE
jgi:hypothetical protein